MIAISMTTPEAPRSAAAVLRDAKWDAILPKLVAYGDRQVRRYGWINDRSRASSVMEPMDLVNAAIDACLSGTWSLPPNVELVTFLCNVMRGLASRRLAQSKRSELTDAADDHPVEGPDLAEARSTLAQIYALAADDDEMTALLGAITEGHTKRDDLAEALGWTSERVRVVRQRLNRRLAKAGLVEEDVLQ